MPLNLLMQSTIALMAAAVCWTNATAGEFPDDYFFSGAKRPAPLRALEGKDAAELSTSAWIGDATTIADHQGDVIVLDFWATWCGPCVASIPKNIKLVNDYKDKGLAFIGIHDSNSGWDRADAMMKDKGVNYPVAKDDGGTTTKAYSLQFWPTYVAIDRKGKIRAAGLRPDKVEDVVKVLLAEPGGRSAATAKSEFPTDWFVGGDKRPASLRRLEGKPAPTLDVETLTQWMAAAPKADDFDGKVLVLRFMSPTDARTAKHLDAWRTQAAELNPHGVATLGLCDPKSDWAALQAICETSKAPPMPIAMDLLPEEGALPMGRHGAACGVRLWPTTIIIDRAGNVRAAGIADKHVKDVVATLLKEPLPEPEAPAS
ncbi:MAG: TlpA family protein disulfide reductase [Phycisphaerales bacterium]|nr:TlpA family protein disulfide reductase [Phycisphaerales bacterium]